MTRMAKPKKILFEKKKIVIRGSGKNKLWSPITAFYQRYEVPVLVGGLLLLTGLLFGLSTLIKKDEIPVEAEAVPASVPAEGNIAPPPPPPARATFPYPNILPEALDSMSNHELSMEVIVEDISIKDFLISKNIAVTASEDIAFQARFNRLNQFRKYHDCYHFKAKDKASADFFIYQISADSFAIISLLPKPFIEFAAISIKTKVAATAGLVKKDFFWKSFLDNGGDHRLMADLAKALQWKIDFYHVQPNDRYKLIYEEKWHDGKVVGLGKLLAVYYKTREKEYYAFRYGDDDQATFFDEEGQIMKMRFLKSPVKYNIINSAYNPNRIHPIHKKEMPHFGTDYFANMDDPVFAVAKGKIIAARQREKNGKYVKIYHDEKYQTQYLHLNSFAEGIRPGKIVEQGEVIGYAGKTGSATGPHVCFRFWMDGAQVDHTKEAIFQNVAPLYTISDISAFEIHRDSLKLRLDQMTAY